MTFYTGVWNFAMAKMQQNTMAVGIRSMGCDLLPDLIVAMNLVPL